MVEFLTSILIYFLGSIALAMIVTLQRALTSRKWPTVEGKVVAPGELKGPDGTPYRFEYEYIVNGQRFVSGMVALFASKDMERKAIQQHQVGSQVLVYYNPAEPKRSILVPGASVRLWTLLCSIIIFCVAGAGILFWKYGHV